MQVQVIIATYGSNEWKRRGQDTMVGLFNWCDAHAYHLVGHSHQLGTVRNFAVQHLDPQEWICFVDADDTLMPGYFNAMDEVALDTNALLTPKLKLGHRPAEKLWRTRDITEMNPCPIGTLIHRSTFDRVGGFWDEPAWEDWSLFRRAFLTGSRIVGVPDAVYVAPASPGGRNSTIPDPKALYASIINSHDEWIRNR